MEYARLGEVSPLSGITPLPGVPPFVLGILNRRGSILAILSLRSLLGIPEPDGTAESSVITLHGPETEFGLAVDEIVGIVSIPAADLLSPSPALTGPGSQYFKASTATGLVLLDVGLLLNDKRLQVREAEGDAP
jgi:purine-binding chemotaxis protein CheW